MSNTSVNRQRGLAWVREWNTHFPPGTAVFLAGVQHRTWSWAGLGAKFEPCVWLEEVAEAVPLTHLQVPGWESKPTRRTC